MTKDRILQAMSQNPEEFATKVLNLAKDAEWLSDQYPTYRDSPTTEEVSIWVNIKKTATFILYNH